MPRDLMAADAVAIPFTYTHQHPSRTMVYRSMASMVAPPTRSPRRTTTAPTNQNNNRSGGGVFEGPSERELRSRLNAASSGGGDTHRVELYDSHHEYRHHQSQPQQSYTRNQSGGGKPRTVSTNKNSLNKTPIRRCMKAYDGGDGDYQQGNSRPSSVASSRGSSSRGRRRPSSSTKKKKRNTTSSSSNYMDSILQQENADLKQKLNEMEARFKKLEDGLSERRNRHLVDLTTPRHPDTLQHTPPPPPPVVTSSSSTPRRSPPSNHFTKLTPHTTTTTSTITVPPVVVDEGMGDYMGYERRTAPLRTWYDSPERTRTSGTADTTTITTTPSKVPGFADGSPRRDASHSCDTSFNYSCTHPHHHPSYEPTSFTAVVEDVASQKKKFSQQVHKPLPPGTFKDYEDFRRGYELLELERAKEQHVRNLEHRLKEARQSPPSRTTSRHMSSTYYHHSKSGDSGGAAVKQGNSAKKQKQKSVASMIKPDLTNNNNITTRKSGGYIRSVSVPHQTMTSPNRSGRTTSKTPARKTKKNSSSSNTNNASSLSAATTRPPRRRATSSSITATSLHTPSISAIGATSSHLTYPHSTDASITATNNLNNNEDSVVAIPCAGTRSGSDRQRMQLYTHTSPDDERGGRWGGDGMYPTSTFRGSGEARHHQRYSDPYHHGTTTSAQPPPRRGSSSGVQRDTSSPSPPRTRDQYWQQSRAVLSELERAFSMGF